MPSPKKSTLLLTLAAALFLLTAGCLPSLNPIYTDKDLVTADEILGRWRKGADTNDLTFAKTETPKTYKLTWTDNGQTGTFEARFIKLSGQLFMDTFPDMDAAKQNLGPYEGHLIPAHFFFRVTLADQKLKLETLSGDAIERHAKTLAIIHRQNDSIITAPTKQLQTFLKRHAQNKKTWNKTTDDEAYRKQ